MARKTGKRAKHERKQQRVLKHGGELDEFVKKGAAGQDHDSKKCQLCKRYFANHNSLTNHLKDSHGVTEKRARKLLAQEKLDRWVKDMDGKLGTGSGPSAGSMNANDSSVLRSPGQGKRSKRALRKEQRSNFSAMAEVMSDGDEESSCGEQCEESSSGGSGNMFYAAALSSGEVWGAQESGAVSSNVGQKRSPAPVVPTLSTGFLDAAVADKMSNFIANDRFGTSTVFGMDQQDQQLSALVQQHQPGLFAKNFAEQQRQAAELGVLRGLAASTCSGDVVSSSAGSILASGEASDGVTAAGSGSPRGWNFVHSGTTVVGGAPGPSSTAGPCSTQPGGVALHQPRAGQQPQQSVSCFPNSTTPASPDWSRPPAVPVVIAPTGPSQASFLPNSLESWVGMDRDGTLPLPTIPESDDDDL